MENSTNKKNYLFKGAGYLTGFLIGTIVAVLFVAITGIEALIGAVAALVSIPAGIVLENKFQGKVAENKSKYEQFTVTFLILGIIFLAMAVVFYKPMLNFDSKYLNLSIEIIIFGFVWNSTFSLFYNRLLVTKK